MESHLPEEFTGSKARSALKPGVAAIACGYADWHVVKVAFCPTRMIREDVEAEALSKLSMYTVDEGGIAAVAK